MARLSDVAFDSWLSPPLVGFLSTVNSANSLSHRAHCPLFRLPSLFLLLAVYFFWPRFFDVGLRFDPYAIHFSPELFSSMLCVFWIRILLYSHMLPSYIV